LIFPSTPVPRDRLRLAAYNGSVAAALRATDREVAGGRAPSRAGKTDRTVDTRSRLASESMAEKEWEPGQESEQAGAPIERDALRCSFCGKAYAEVGIIVCGPTPSVAICNECVELCTDIIAEERGPTRPA
jgi:hypothetical protein